MLNRIFRCDKGSVDKVLKNIVDGIYIHQVVGDKITTELDLSIYRLLNGTRVITVRDSKNKVNVILQYHVNGVIELDLVDKYYDLHTYMLNSFWIDIEDVENYRLIGETYTTGIDELYLVLKKQYIICNRWYKKYLEFRVSIDTDLVRHDNDVYVRVNPAIVNNLFNNLALRDLLKVNYNTYLLLVDENKFRTIIYKDKEVWISNKVITLNRHKVIDVTTDLDTVLESLKDTPYDTDCNGCRYFYQVAQVNQSYDEYEIKNGFNLVKILDGRIKFG